MNFYRILRYLEENLDMPGFNTRNSYPFGLDFVKNNIEKYKEFLVLLSNGDDTKLPKDIMGIEFPMSDNQALDIFLRSDQIQGIWYLVNGGTPPAAVVPPKG